MLEMQPSIEFMVLPDTKGAVRERHGEGVVQVIGTLWAMARASSRMSARHGQR